MADFIKFLLQTFLGHAQHLNALDVEVVHRHCDGKLLWLLGAVVFGAAAVVCAHLLLDLVSSGFLCEAEWLAFAGLVLAPDLEVAEWLVRQNGKTHLAVGFDFARAEVIVAAAASFEGVAVFLGDEAHGVCAAGYAQCSLILLHLRGLTISVE